MIFYCKKIRNYDFKSNVKINGVNLELVRQFNYLGTALSDLWFNRKKARCEINKCEIAYHKCVKKIASMGTRDCNNEACAITGLNIFNHLIDKKLVNFLFFNKSRCVYYLKRCFVYNSFMYEDARNILYDSCNVSNVLGNGKSAICAWIDFIQRFHVCGHLLIC